MSCKLPTDCLNEIFECLEDRMDLYSCLSVNRPWCEVSVRILWKSVQTITSCFLVFLMNRKKTITKFLVFEVVYIVYGSWHLVIIFSLFIISDH